MEHNFWESRYDSHRETVTIKELLSDDNFKNTSLKIPICIGKDISGNIEVIDLSKTPHLLVAGTTGSVKSVFIAHCWLDTI